MTAAQLRYRLPRWALGALVGATLLFLLVPLVAVVLSSFTSGEYISLPPQTPLSVRWYGEFLRDHTYLHALEVSVRVGLTVALIATAVGTAAALGFGRERFRGRELLRFLLFLPFLMPGIVLGIGIALSLRPLGLEFLRGSSAVLVLGHLLWATPVVFVTVAAKLQDTDPELENAARTLGASRWRVWREVTLPLLAPALFAGSILAFVVSFHDFAMALFLAGPETTTLPVVVWNALRFEVRPIIAAIDSIMVVSVIGAIGLLGRLVGLDRITMG
jgi:ABC-type spermidine/putrescine transport system permease subunit II